MSAHLGQPIRPDAGGSARIEARSLYHLRGDDPVGCLAVPVPGDGGAVFPRGTFLKEPRAGKDHHLAARAAR